MPQPKIPDRPVPGKNCKEDSQRIAKEILYVSDAGILFP
jgi:hypothetical protein